MDIDGKSSWVLQLPELITGPELSSDEYAAKEESLISAITSSGDSILQILQPLGHYLTMENDTPRSKAASLLAKVVRDVPQAIRTPEEVHHLAEFFTARLKDWPAIRGALLGCLALFERTQPPPAATTPASSQPAHLSTADALSILSSFSKNVYVRSLSAFDRATALTTLRIAVDHFGQAALDDGIDILEFAISSVDGEKDPRCLIQGFQAMRCVMKLYITQEETTLASGRLEESTEELFDVLSCYFPVAFTPPPNDPHGITRGQIASELESALTVYPAFAPFILELVSEKLGSTLLVAKMDALHLLQTAAVAEGGVGRAMQMHIPAIWTALKKEIMAPTTEGLVEPELVKVEEVAVAAAECLRACIVAFSRKTDSSGDGEQESSSSSSSLPFLVLNDTGVEDMFTCIASPGLDRASLRRSVARVKSMSLALGTLGSAGGHPAVEMSSTIIPRLLDAIDATIISQNSSSPAEISRIQSQDLAWASLASLLRAMNTSSSRSNVDEKNSTKNDHVQQQVMSEALLGRLLNLAMDKNTNPCLENKNEINNDEASGDVDPMDESEASQSTSIARTTNPTSTKLWLWDLSETSLHRIQWLKLTALQAVLSCDALTAVISEMQGQEILGFLVKAAIDNKTTNNISGNGGSGRGLRQPKVAAAAAAALCAAARLLDSEIVIEYALMPLLKASTEMQISSSEPSRRAALAALNSLCVSNPTSLLQPTMVGIEAALHPALQQQAANASLVNDILSTVSEIILEVAESSDHAAHDMHAACFATFAEHLLDEILLLTQEKKADANSYDDILVENIAQAVFLGTREASVEAQKKFCTAAVEAISLSTTILTSTAGYAAFVALRSEVATEEVQTHPTILSLLAEKATGSDFTTGSTTTSAAAVALASFLNKIETSQLNSTEVTSVLDTLVNKTLQNATSYGAVAEVTRALAMRGATAPADKLIKQIASSLKSSSNSLTAASTFFARILCSEDDDDSSNRGHQDAPALVRSAHAVVKPLWKQRTFNVAAAALDTASKDMHVQHEDTTNRILMCAMGSLLGAAPPAVLRADSARTLPWLVRCLSELSKQEDEQEASISSEMSTDITSTTKMLLQSLLKSTFDFLSSESGRKQVEGSLPTLIPALVRLGQYTSSMTVREMSLRCLTMLMMLPYAVLHPYKKEVLRVATAAADDLKRSVRGAAALCREAWGGGSTSIF